MKFDESEQLPKALRRLVTNLDADLRRAQNRRLRQGDVVALQQSLGRQIAEADQPLFALQIGEDSLINGIGRHAERLGHLLKDGGPIERGNDGSDFANNATATTGRGQKYRSRSCSGGCPETVSNSQRSSRSLASPWWTSWLGSAPKGLVDVGLQLAAVRPS